MQGTTRKLTDGKRWAQQCRVATAEFRSRASLRRLHRRASRRAQGEALGAAEMSAGGEAFRCVRYCAEGGWRHQRGGAVASALPICDPEVRCSTTELSASGCDGRQNRGAVSQDTGCAVGVVVQVLPGEFSATAALGTASLSCGCGASGVAGMKIAVELCALLRRDMRCFVEAELEF